MINILVISRNESENVLIQKKMAPLKNDFVDLRFHSARGTNYHNVVNSETSLIVYNTHVFNGLTIKFVRQCRQIEYNGPIIILSKPNEKYNEQVQELENVILVEKPYQNVHLNGVARNFLYQNPVSQRKFRRFEVREKAVIEPYDTGEPTDTTIHNISRGGLLIKGDEIKDLNQGDLLRVHFNLNKINKKRSMNARVVWKGKKEGDDTVSAGLEFVSQMAVYNYLLNYALS